MLFSINETIPIHNVKQEQFIGYRFSYVDDGFQGMTASAVPNLIVRPPSRSLSANSQVILGDSWCYEKGRRNGQD